MNQAPKRSYTLKELLRYDPILKPLNWYYWLTQPVVLLAQFTFTWRPLSTTCSLQINGC
jgi:hypothetical protein